ncbi:MAG: orotidine-5'-phosphate decarboxylase [Fretibacterium sp.]|nr:orotidine-5'-phosphate decarboxylase [Fretibacterium sp.]
MQIDKLIRAIRELNNPSALGLDTRLQFVPKSFSRPYLEAKRSAEAVFAFNSALLSGLRDLIPCVKIQAAYYELMGLDGIACLSKTIHEAHRLDYVVIVDAKRGDIGATASAYSEAYLASGAPFPADFLTVNPYLGSDGILPFLSDCKKTGRGIFTLLKTSNPSSGEFQDLLASDGRPFYDHVADKIALWGEGLKGEEGYYSVGAVVGATYPKQGEALRARLPHTFFLLPGYGAQGAVAADLAGCFDAAGEGAIVAASRSLICAHQRAGTDDFVSAARDEALRMKGELNDAIRTKGI